MYLKLFWNISIWKINTVLTASARKGTVQLATFLSENKQCWETVLQSWSMHEKKNSSGSLLIRLDRDVRNYTSLQVQKHVSFALSSCCKSKVVKTKKECHSHLLAAYPDFCKLQKCQLNTAIDQYCRWDFFFFAGSVNFFWQMHFSSCTVKKINNNI